MPCGICGEFCGGYVPLCDKCNGEKIMTNELGTTLQDIEAKAEKKRRTLEVLNNAHKFSIDTITLLSRQSNLRKVDKDLPLVIKYTDERFETIRKYIEEN